VRVEYAKTLKVTCEKIPWAPQGLNGKTEKDKNKKGKGRRGTVERRKNDAIYQTGEN